MKKIIWYQEGTCLLCLSYLYNNLNNNWFINEIFFFKVQQCKLTIDTTRNIVAYGSVFPLDEPIHGVPLGPMNLYVSIDVAIKEYVLHPTSCESLNIKQAIESHVAWPWHFVVTNDEVLLCEFLTNMWKKL